MKASLVIILSAAIGVMTDKVFHVSYPPLFWLLGVLAGLIAGIIDANQQTRSNQ